MRPKPRHLGPAYAAQFQDPAVAAAYPHRPPYPAALFPVLADLAGPPPRAVLDIGCGTGDLARPLAPSVDRLDAVDFSAAMLARARTFPGGDHPAIRWIAGRVEDVPLAPPYQLVVAGESLHWMDWAVVLPRLRALLVPGGFLALVARVEQPPRWAAALQRLITRYSTNREYQPYDLIDELQQRALFTRVGGWESPPVPFTQSIAGYVESFHSRNGFSRDRMAPLDAQAFDAAVRDLVQAACPDGQVHLQIRAALQWGHPAPATG